MPGRGPAPNPQRRRRNADTYADVHTTVQATAPAEPTSARTLSAATCGLSDSWGSPIRELLEQWWATWAASPLTKAWLDTDWQRLAMLAPLVASYYMSPHYTKLAEIRQSESLLGATHVDRLRARIKVEPAPAAAPAQPPGVTAISEYRDRLAG